jgi:hypothetical protein
MVAIPSDANFSIASVCSQTILRTVVMSHAPISGRRSIKTFRVPAAKT